MRSESQERPRSGTVQLFHILKMITSAGQSSTNLRLWRARQADSSCFRSAATAPWLGGRGGRGGGGGNVGGPPAEHSPLTTVAQCFAGITCC